MNFSKIETNESVVTKVVNQIKKSILNGELGPGDKIPTEIELIDQLGVGRNSVREAIKILTAIGVLEVRRGQGTFVVEKIKPTFFDPIILSMILEPQSNHDLYELRVLFDSMVMLNVIDKITEKDILDIEKSILETENTYRSSIEYDIDYFVERDMAFHKNLLEITNNPLIIRIGKSILDLFPNYIKKSISQENGISRSINNHYKILEVIKREDKAHVVESIEGTLVEWKNEWQKK